jgi:hypothetical protein
MRNFGLLGIFVGFCISEFAPAFAQTKPSSDQKAGACSVNVSGNANTVSIKCDGVDRTVAEDIETILNRTLNNVKATKDLSAKLDRLLKEMSLPQTTVAIAPSGIANAAPNMGAQTVNNFAPPARTIPAEIRSECRDLLSRTPLKVSVHALVGDVEGFKYAKEWYDLFAASGWEMADPQVMSIIQFGTPTQGIEISFRGDRPTSSGQLIAIPQSLTPLAACFEKAQVHVIANPYPDTPENFLIFMIGSNPN